jgi:hemoglobin-like flavoprotein
MGLSVEILESSFKTVAPRGEAFVAEFYERLFRANPEARAFFAGTDMPAQRTKLLAALAMTVENLRRPEVLAPALRELGKKHVAYGVTAEHYPLVGAALLGTLGAFLGPAFTPEVQQAWADAYAAITSLMLDGANGHAG